MAVELKQRSEHIVAYYLVYAGAMDSISVAAFVLAAIIYSRERAPFLKVACKVLSRFLSLFKMEDAAEFLASCPTQMARALGWDSVGHDDVMMALVAMLQQTESEALMKHRVLVEVVHSTLLRTAILGLIDKGIPAVLHDYGLKTMMLHMQKLLSSCESLQAAAKETDALVSDQAETAPRRRTSITGGTRTSVERFAAGLTAVGGAARNAGTLLATTFQDEADQVESSDPRNRFGRRLDRCVDALRDVTSEIAEYTTTGYTTVFKSFEKMNDDLELIGAMQSSSHAIALTQAAFYTTEILREALAAALLDASDDDTAMENGDANANPKAPVLPGSDKSNASSNGRDERSSQAAYASVVLEKAGAVLGWITISLQHSDMDVLFYGSKLMQLGSYAEALIRLPLDEHDDEHIDGNGLQQGLGHLHTDAVSGLPNPDHSSERLRSRDQQPSITPRRRIRRTENYPVFLRFRSLELRSWLWSVRGFLPYLRVRHNGSVKLIRFTKTAATSEPTDDSASRLRDMFREYLCGFEVHGAEIDHHIETFYRDLPHTVDVEVWVYLPFWPRDVLVSRAKVPLLARSIESDSYKFHFYPESARGVRSYQQGIIGTLSMEFAKLRSKASAAEVAADTHEFPAYSTLGSRFIRGILRAVWTRIFTWTSDAVSTVAEVTQGNRLMEAANMRRRGLSVAAMQNLSDSLEHEGKYDSVFA